MKVEERMKVEALLKHRNTLKNISYDKAHDEYMVESSVIAIDFDEVVKEYKGERQLYQIPKSNDALVFEEGGRIFFVEFKNGAMKSQVDSCKIKIYDSNLILMDLTGISVEDLRKSVEYVLVYNEKKGEAFIESEKNKACGKISTSPSLTRIGQIFSGYGKSEFVLFGLKKFQNYCFKAVHTYTVREFEEYLGRI